MCVVHPVGRGRSAYLPGALPGTGNAQRGPQNRGALPDSVCGAPAPAMAPETEAVI